MTTQPTTAAADQALATMCTTHGEYLAGILADAMLDTAGRPDKLPALLLPDLDPAVVERIWKVAVPVGFRMGKSVGQPQWTAANLRHSKNALADAGYHSMAALADRSHRTTTHPGDTEPVREHS
ncbi:hypothetical protein ACFWV1_26065 [Streptomyces sp. NPDC058700]|uniref:hypothetical protein n=1 Tax=Streptomyces sp. NPDC058700 TaxID=3346607 RepID=UPI00364F2D64